MTTEIVADASTLTPEQAELQARARAFVEEVLIPLEVEAERARGRLPAERIARDPPRGARRGGLGGGLHAVEHGGQGWTPRRSGSSSRSSSGARRTRCRGTCPSAYNVLAHGTPEQIDR